MMRKSIPAFALLIGATVLVVPRPSSGAMVSVCPGNNRIIRWPAAFRMHALQCSFPSGSTEMDAYLSAGWQWGQVFPLMDYGRWWLGCTYAHGDGNSTTARVAPSHIGGALGNTKRVWDCSQTTAHYDEMDVEMRSDMIFSPEDESYYGLGPISNPNFLRQGRSTLVHEFGHALGLEEMYSDLAMMRVYGALPLAGGNTSEPFPDDANGVRWLYSAQNMVSKNVFVSAQTVLSDAPYQGRVWVKGFLVPENYQWYGYCRGSPITLNVTVGNNGTQYVNSGLRLYLNNGPTPYVGGWNVWVGRAWLPGNSWFTESLPGQIPWDIPYGYYWTFWQIDTQNEHAEWNEGDNAVHGPLLVSIFC
jgi:hypothetical protein